MIFISHRGNINNKKPKFENNPDYIAKAIKMGFDVEIDIRIKNDEIYLGHDYEQYKINEDFINKNKNNLWIHAKNDKALFFLSDNKNKYNFFWHENDKFTMTSKGYLWTHYKTNLNYFVSKTKVNNKTILNLPEMINLNDNFFIFNNNYIGISSDNILFYKSYLDEKK